MLDLGLPRLDGITVLKRWRASGIKTPVLVLTARGAWTERVEGIDAGADDMSDDDEGWEIVCPPERFETVRDAVKAIGVEPARAAIAMVPQNFIKLVGKEAQQMLRLMEAIEDHDDVQHVWANFDVEEKEIEASLA